MKIWVILLLVLSFDVIICFRQIVDLGENLSLFKELQPLGDKNLRKLAFSHVVCSIKRMNKKCKNEAKNKALQIVLFKLLKVLIT